MIAVILAGGKGERLWPVSTEKRPKQFCDLTGQGSLLSTALRRLQSLGPMIVVCGDEHRVLIENEINNMEFTVLTEPLGRNTAPAVGLVLASGSYEAEDILGFFPADHFIRDEKVYRSIIRQSEQLAKEGYLVTVGIAPAYPETGYGYIERALDKDEISVRAFHEKPDFETAAAYVNSGNYLWNAGIFIASVQTWLALLEKHLSELYVHILAGPEPYRAAYQEYPDISIDYGIAEKCDRIAVLEGNFGWSDIGSWEALAAVMEQDEQGNALAGDVAVIESSACLARSSQKKLLLFGVEDLVVVETEDTILVCPKNRSQSLRQVVDLIRDQGKRE